ncbi:hypothetical protein F5I97DRAFT_684499 [Phlebopus sp. FC_14]|nr:hypothetical protein F5I97DRAFT_684499 [Phlebopus sp. FC_14]
MDDPPATSPPPLHTRISPKHSEYEKSLPPSPPPSSTTTRRTSSTKSRSHSPSSPSSNQRRHHHTTRPRTKDLLHLLTSSQSTSHSLEHQLTQLTSQLAFEQDRADTAERRLRDTLSHIKDAHDARARAQSDLARVSEELALYKRALEDAQKEIFRAQEVVRGVEARRRDVEEEAVGLRRQLRKMREESRMAAAREEGLEMGKDIGYLKGRNKGYVNGRMVGGRYSQPLDDDDDGDQQPSESEAPYTATTMRYPPSHSAASSSPAPPDVQPQHQQPPPSARTTMYSPAHAHVDIPPDGWIPEADAASHIIRLPPPHELARPPPTPGASPPLRPADVSTSTSTSSSGSGSPPPLHPVPCPANTVPVLMIPEPKTPRGSGAYRDLSGARSHVHAHQHSHRVNRRSSRDSIGTSTTTRTSELDLLNAPDEYVSRGVAGGGRRISGLSAIPEVVSLQETTVSSGSGGSGGHMGEGGEDRVDEAGFVHVSMPTPHTPLPKSKSKSPGSVKPGTSPNPSFLSVDQRSPSSRPNSTSSFGTVNITVQPPSRPPSNISQAPSTRPNLLSPADADRPLPLPSSPHAPAGLPDVDVRVELVNDLPPGFIPTGLPTPSPSSYTSTPAVIPPPSRRADESESDESVSDAGTLTTPPLRGRYRVPGSESEAGYTARSGRSGYTGYTAARVPLPPASSVYTPYTAAGVSLPPSTPYSYVSGGGGGGGGGRGYARGGLGE